MTMHRLWYLAAAFLLASVVGISSPQAQTEDPKEQAAKLYKEGVDAYLGGDYAIAITKFREGYGLDPNSMFLYNLSLCFWKLGNFQEALNHAEKAEELGEMPDEAATRNPGRVASFKVVLHAEAVATAMVTPEDPGPPTCATDSECENGYVCNIRRGLCVESFVPPPTEPLFSVIGWTGVGVGAAGVVLTAIALIINFSLADDIRTQRQLVADGQTQEAAALAAQIKGRQTTGIVLLLGGIGGVVAGGGLVAYDLYFAKDGDVEGAAVVPYISADGGGLVWRLRF